MEKIFTNLDKQIAILKSRGMKFDTDEDYNYAKTVLMQTRYYTIVNGYNKLFMLNKETNSFKPGTMLRELHGLYQFDSKLRQILFRYILKVEANIKNLISYYFSEKYGHKNYLIYTNFNSKIKNAGNKISTLLADIQKQIAQRCTDPCISHYLEIHGYVPFWVLSNILTLGTISKFYSLMRQEERQKVSKHFNIMDNELENIILYLTPIRNFSAHGNRLYCYRSNRPLMDTQYHDKLNIQKLKTEYLQGKRDLFASYIALKSVLSKNDFKRMSKEISKAIKKLSDKLIVVETKDVLSEMEFPTNWGNLQLLK